MIRRIVPPLLLVAALLGAWELYVDSGAVDSVVLPAPHGSPAPGSTTPACCSLTW